VPDIKDLLKDDETVINHHYMAQLLDYGLRMGLTRDAPMSREELFHAAEVCFSSLVSLSPV
jgi:hypothetical protein